MLNKLGSLTLQGKMYQKKSEFKLAFKFIRRLWVWKYWPADFNDMITHLGLFYSQRLRNCFHQRIIFTSILLLFFLGVLHSLTHTHTHIYIYIHAVVYAVIYKALFSYGTRPKAWGTYWDLNSLVNDLLV